MGVATKVLTLLGTITGALVILYGLFLFFAMGNWAGFLIALAVIIVGPMEDWLQNFARSRVHDESIAEQWVTLVDRATSLAFLLLLMGTLLLLR